MTRTALALLLATTTPALADAPNIIADIPATGSLVQQVLGDMGQVRVLLPAGGDAHHHQLRPSDAAALQDADVLVWIGPALTPWLERSSRNVAQGVSLVLSDQPGTSLREFGKADDHDHAHEHGDSHEHGAIDPHVWLDPENGRNWLKTIADTLAKADPENAATYQQNAQAGVARIEAAEKTINGALSGLTNQPFAVSHDAYGYFTEHFDLPPAIAVSLGDAATPSAARLSQVREQIEAAQVTCIFPEAGHDPALLESLIQGTQTRLGAPLDPAGTGLEMGPDLYPALLEGMGTTIADCLSQGR